MENFILEVSNIHKSFGPKEIIRDVSLKVAHGDVFGFLGPNGAGKTTIIRMILGLIYPNKGTIKINGYDIKRDFNKAIASVGAIVETPKFYSYLSGYQNLLLTANLHPKVPKKRIQEILDIVGLTKRADDKVGTYSLGMKQRLGIARALVNNPQLIFLDEPMNGLDPQGMVEMRELIRSLAIKQNISFFITSHLLYEIEQVCNKVAILKEGRLITQSKVEDLLTKETEQVEVYADKLSDASSLLSNLAFVKDFQLFKEKILVEIDKGTSNQLNAYLVQNNIDIKYLIPKNQSLEDYFINLTEGGVKDVKLN